MTFKEFISWCRERQRDRRWDWMTNAMCFGIILDIRSNPHNEWEKRWNLIKDQIIEKVINPIEEMRIK